MADFELIHCLLFNTIVNHNDVVPDLDPAHEGEQVGVRILALDLRGYPAQLCTALKQFPLISNNSYSPWFQYVHI